jgi:hypothetical protein
MRIILFSEYYYIIERNPWLVSSKQSPNISPKSIPRFYENPRIIAREFSRFSQLFLYQTYLSESLPLFRLFSTIGILIQTPNPLNPH